MTARLRGLPAAARAEGAAVRRLPVVLPDGDAADPGRRDVDGPVPGQAHHASGAAAGGGGAGDRRRPSRSPRRAARPTTSSARWSKRSTAWPSELAASRRELERSTDRSRAQAPRSRRAAPLHRDDPRAHRDGRRLGRRRRASSARSTTPAARLLGLGPDAVGRPAPRGLRARAIWRRWRRCFASAASRRGEPPAQEVALVRDGRELHLAAVATPLAGEVGRIEGTVLVFDDVTPLIRSQKVAAWREVARRLAHEIKNPLTPIQLSAERLRRHFGAAPPPTRALVDECTTTIVGEVESLKGLVDEFSQFARMPAPQDGADRPARAARRHAGALRRAVRRGAFRAALCRGPAARARGPRAAPARRHQPGGQRHRSDGAARPDHGRDAATIAADNVVRLVVADDGPGIPDGDRDKLFMPYLLDQAAAAAASAWPSSAASSPSTAAASR